MLITSTVIAVHSYSQLASCALPENMYRFFDIIIYIIIYIHTLQVLAELHSSAKFPP